MMVSDIWTFVELHIK